MSERQSMFVRIIAIAMIVLAFGLYIYSNRSSVFAPESEMVGFVHKFKPITYDYNAQAGFYSGGRGYFYFYARNSISYRDSSAEVVWVEQHDLSNPLAFGAGDYLVLSELQGNSVRVYAPDGLRHIKYFDHPVIHFNINESGFCTIRIQEGTGYRMWIYDVDGAETYMRFHGTANVFPMASAVSLNGRELAISLLDVNGVNIQTHLLLSHVLEKRSIADSVGEWGGYRKDKQIIASLKYNGNNDLLTASDVEIAHYRITGDGRSSKAATVELGNYVSELAYMGDAGVVLALGRGIPELDSFAENTVQFYDGSLELLGSFTAPRAISYLHAGRQGAIVGAGSYYGFNAEGVLQWQYHTPRELKQLIYINGTDTILEAGFTEARILRRERLTGSDSAQPDPAMTPVHYETEDLTKPIETSQPIEPVVPTESFKSDEAIEEEGSLH